MLARRKGTPIERLLAREVYVLASQERVYGAGCRHCFKWGLFVPASRDSHRITAPAFIARFARDYGGQAGLPAIRRVGLRFPPEKFSPMVLWLSGMDF